MTPPEDCLSPLTAFVADGRDDDMEFGLFPLEQSIESKRETMYQLHSGTLSPLATVLEAPEDESAIHYGGAVPEYEEVENNGPSDLPAPELPSTDLEETNQNQQTNTSPIAEFSERWEIIAEREREGYSAFIAVSNTNRHYWRMGDRYKALNSEEEADLDNWWNTFQPQPVWVQPEYKKKWQFETPTNEEVFEPNVVLSKETSYNPCSSLPFTGQLNPRWAFHSGVDHNGQIYLVQKANDEYLLSQGHRILVGQVCKWVAVSSPALRRDTRQKFMATGQPVPELIITSPDGTVDWLDDFTYYNGETSWADLDSDDED